MNGKRFIEGWFGAAVTAALLGLAATAKPVLAATEAAEPDAGASAQARAQQDAAWDGALRQQYFGDRPIVESDAVIVLDAPERAENAAIVPIAIRSHAPADGPGAVRTIWLVIDRNPGPLAGTFHLSERNGRADLDLRVRINEYTPVRAVAETAAGALHMSRRFVKASGGCSAPASGDLDAALARIGQMRIRTRDGLVPGQPTPVQLLVSHPNLNGLQMDQVSGLYTPARFVKEVRVRFEGDEIFRAETSFAISENPSFGFYFVPQHEGELSAEVIDTDGQRFVHAERLTLAAEASRP
jgi:sulfur-oxidizing protein SoxY